jgi:hypothetical protein
MASKGICACSGPVGPEGSGGSGGFSTTFFFFFFDVGLATVVPVFALPVWATLKPPRQRHARHRNKIPKNHRGCDPGTFHLGEFFPMDFDPVLMPNSFGKP